MRALSLRRVAPPTVQTLPVPAPVGGIDSVSPLSAMSLVHATRLYNVIASESGLRSRLGYREWNTRLQDYSNYFAGGSATQGVAPVLSIIPFAGSASSSDRLFAVTDAGIWNVTDKGAYPALYTGNTAYSVGDIAYNSGFVPRFRCVTAGTSASDPNLLPQEWAAATAYSLNYRALKDGNVYIATTGGTSGSDGPSGTGTGITDGTVIWNYQSSDRTVTDGTVVWSYLTGNVDPALEIAFEDPNNAGRCQSTIKVTDAGHFLHVCEEVNGLYIYPESEGQFTKIDAGTTQAWAGSTAYLIGDLVVNEGNVYVCDTDGVSAASGGPTGTSTNITDGTTQWDWVSVSSTTAIGPSLADQRAGLELDPGDFVSVLNWKGRTWYVERDTARAWFLEPGAIYGTATSYDFGGNFSQGGTLRNLFNYTRDGADGMDDFLVAISDGGDVNVYQGTDPASITTFGPVGFHNVGAIPAGRDIASKLGGDLLILSKQGLVSLSVLLAGGKDDPLRQATARVSNLFNRYMLNASTLPGWTVRIHPEDNALMVTVPTYSGQATNQMVMSLANKGWSEYRDLPIYSSAVWGGKLYFGTTDGRVCVNDVYADNVLIDNSASTAIQCRILSAFMSPGQGSNVQMVGIRTTFTSEAGRVGYNAAARYKYDITELSSATAASGVGWDSDLWDTDVWGGDSTTTQEIVGATGDGKEMAVATRFAAVGRTTYVGSVLHYNVGGPL